MIPAEQDCLFRVRERVRRPGGTDGSDKFHFPVDVLVNVRPHRLAIRIDERFLGHGKDFLPRPARKLRP